MKISVVIPAYNEAENVEPLLDELFEVLDGSFPEHEVIVVDDGSTDDTLRRLHAARETREGLRIIEFQGNFGQTAAIDAGFQHAEGDVIILLDADMQNDPHDIPRLVARLDEGFDVVCGWRFDRKDTLGKRFTSRGANVLRKIILRDQIHDSGCTLKALRRECVQGLHLHGEMHRFIPALLQWRGFKITEEKVNHRSRLRGTTKYNIFRVGRGLMDMLVVGFWQKYSARPAHFFGFLGLLSSTAGFGICAYLAIRKIQGHSIADRPLLLLGVLGIIIGLQFITFGLLADMLAKIFFRDTRPYVIRRVHD
jgi:glycosyltransferase involved in cell wall biosynthesis